ncbi:hypothetical protein ACJMK2_039484 [Sinanodonta woodiana]|uniref:C-type lectin domain-containing protein n=1 Tax=Sinanodonta woodiana TaxID=1069815 RepID=A0ABD3WC60_SINWO
MKIPTLLGFLVLLTSSPMTNSFPKQFNQVPITEYHHKPVAGSNFGYLALAVIAFSILFRPSPTKPPVPKCPSGYTLYENVCGRFCYRLESQSCRSFANAQAICKEEGGDLLKPSACSYPMFRGLSRQQTGNCEDFWVGAFRTLPALNYVTVGGAALEDNFQFWGENQPSRTVNAGRQQACVQIDNGFDHLLNDDFCTDTVGFICQTLL